MSTRTPNPPSQTDETGSAKLIVQPSVSHATASKRATTASTSSSINRRRPPQHPIPCMQAAFEESIMEYSEEAFSYVKDRLNAHARRQQLLEEDVFGNEYSARWRQKSGSKYHPLWKLIAQISFGIHLLHQRTAKSDHEVVKILQTHVDEIDSFLEDTMADFDLATSDIEERIEYLILPLHNGRTFEQMLRDRVFRSAILDGNDVIERIIARTTSAMSAALDDVGNGLEGTAELAKYLDRLGSEWTRDNEDLRSIYAAMRANAEGWYACFKSIQLKGEHLRLQCSVLQSTVTEVARRCGMVSRRTESSRRRREERQASGDSAKSRKSSRMPSFDKPLPPDPLTKALAARVGHHESETSDSPQASTNPSSVTRLSMAASPVSDNTTPATAGLSSTPSPKEHMPSNNFATQTTKAPAASRPADPLRSNAPLKATSCPPPSKTPVMADSAYSSCSSSVATSPKTNIDGKQMPISATLMPSNIVSSLKSSTEGKRLSHASLTALPQLSNNDSRKDNKSGLSSLKVLFSKKQTDKDKSLNKKALGGNVAF